MEVDKIRTLKVEAFFMYVKSFLMTIIFSSIHGCILIAVAQM